MHGLRAESHKLLASRGVWLNTTGPPTRGFAACQPNAWNQSSSALARRLPTQPQLAGALGKPLMRHHRRRAEDARHASANPPELAAAILLLPAATASADTIVFVKDANVWAASPDGSDQRQLTRDGTADHPYRSPSQADDGTVAASYLDSIRLIGRGGKLLRELDPPALTNSVSHVMDGTPVDVAVSPDGSKIAYTFVQASCPLGASAGREPRPATRLGHRRSAAWQPLPAQPELGRQLAHAPVRRLPAPGQHARPRRRRGRALVRRRGHRRPGRRDRPRRRRARPATATSSRWCAVTAATRTSRGTRTTAPPALPSAQCATGRLEGLQGPTWAPDGESLAWGEPDGVWIKPSALDCTVQPALVIPGAGEPDWGPASRPHPPRRR